MTLLDLHLGRPLTRGALTIFPIWNGHAVSSRGYNLGPEGLAVSERTGSAVVAELVAINTGSRPALLLEGELLEGGRQHRVTARSVLVGAGRSEPLAVRCVEQGRWAGAGSHRRSGRRAPLSVRTANGQGATWERISRYEQRYGANETGSLLAVTEGPDSAAAALVEGVRPLPYQSGVLLCLAGQPVQLEAFDSPRTLVAGWDALLHAAALDALTLTAVATPGRRARRFLDRLTHVPTASSAAGAAQTLAGQSPYAHLQSLVWRGRAVHTVAVNPRHELVAA